MINPPHHAVGKKQGRGKICYVLEDASIQGLSPERWAKHAMSMVEKWEADYLLIEINQGGEMVKSVFKAIGAHIPIKTVRASKSKSSRAEPVAALYEQGKVKHVGRFEALETELMMMGTPGNGKHSPDRADALVWAVSHLCFGAQSDPRIRSL